MGLFNLIDPVLDLGFGFLLNLDPALGIAIIALIVSLIITLIHKFATNQTLMKELKEKQKEFSNRIKESKEDPKKAMSIQKEAMAANMEYMKHSFRPMLFTFIPIIIIFGWLSSNFAYLPIEPNEEFTTTMLFNGKAGGNVSITVPEGIDLISDEIQKIEDKRVSWKLKGEEGEYDLLYEYNGELLTKNVIISEEKDYAPNAKRRKSFIDYIYSSSDGFLPRSSLVTQISIDNAPLKPLPFSIFGWKPGWLGTYIILSIIMSIVLRKVLKIH